MYFFVSAFFVLTYCLNEIRLAMEAMSVPRPPTLVPMISFEMSEVKPEHNIAAGTLLMN